MIIGRSGLEAVKYRGFLWKRRLQSVEMPVWTPVSPPNEQLAADLTFWRDPTPASSPTPDSEVSDAWAQQKIVIRRILPAVLIRLYWSVLVTGDGRNYFHR